MRPAAGHLPLKKRPSTELLTEQVQPSSGGAPVGDNRLAAAAAASDQQAASISAQQTEAAATGDAARNGGEAAAAEPPPKRQRQQDEGDAAPASVHSESPPSASEQQQAEPPTAQQPAQQPLQERQQDTESSLPQQQQQPRRRERSPGDQRSPTVDQLQQQQPQQRRATPQQPQRRSSRSPARSPARSGESGGEAQASSDHAGRQAGSVQGATSAALDNTSPRGATSRREKLQPNQRDPSFEFGNLTSQGSAPPIGGGFQLPASSYALPRISTAAPQPALLSKALFEELSGTRQHGAEGGSPISTASWLRNGSHSNDYSSQTLASFGLRPSGSLTGQLPGASQRIFGVDVSPNGSPLLGAESGRSLQSSPRSAFTAVASLQSARSSSVSANNVRAELARLLPGLSPFTALSDPGPQGLAGGGQGLGAAHHSIGAGGRQGSGPGPGALQGLSPAQQASLAALHQQAFARERAAAAAGSGGGGERRQAGGTLGAPPLGESPADALAALQHASNWAAREQRAADLTPMASLQGWAAPGTASPGAASPPVAGGGSGRSGSGGMHGATPPLPPSHGSSFNGNGPAGLGLRSSGLGLRSDYGGAGGRSVGIDASAVAYSNPFAVRSVHSEEVERLLGRMPHEAGNPGGGPRESGLRTYSPYGLGAGGGSGGLQAYSMRDLVQLPASCGPAAGHPPNRIRTASVPGRAWAAEGIPRLASQRAAAERPGFGDAAAAAQQHPASLRAQSDSAAARRHHAAAAAAAGLGSPRGADDLGYGPLAQYMGEGQPQGPQGGPAAHPEAARRLLLDGTAAAAADVNWGSLPKKARTSPEMLSHARAGGGGGASGARGRGETTSGGGGGGRGGGGKKAPQQSAIEQHYLAELRKFIEEKGGALAPGWSVRVRTRSVLLHGKERQQKDAFYNSPGGEVYNSRKKVAVAMGLMSADDNTRTASVPRLPANKSPAEPPAAATAAAAAADETAAAQQQPQPATPATPHSRLSPVSARSQPGGASGDMTETDGDGDGDTTPAGSGGDYSGGTLGMFARTSAHSGAASGGAVSGGGLSGGGGGGGGRSTRQQQHNKEAQKRYRERKRERSAALEQQVGEMGAQLRQLAALRHELAVLAAANEELRGAVVGRDEEVARLRRESETLLSAAAGGGPAPHLHAVLASKEAALAQRFATGADAAGWQASRLAALAAENAELRAALNAS